MQTINHKIIEGRLSLLKAIKESTNPDVLDVILRYQHQFDSLGALVQNEINGMWAGYFAIGCGFEEFRVDLIEMLKRCGFSYQDDIVKGYDLKEGIVVYELLAGLDFREPYSEVQMRFQIMEPLS